MDSFINSRIGLKLVIFFARNLSPRLGNVVTRAVARWIASRSGSEIVSAITANQQIVAGGDLPPQTLERRVQGVIQHSARSIYELYHHLHNLESAGHLFVIDPSFRSLIDRPKYDDRGLVIAGLHMSGFDLAFQWLCSKWIEPLGLTIPTPAGGRGLEFELRQRVVFEMVPGSFAGLRQAIRYLDQGGLVATGIDRPDPDFPLSPCFFGYPASLPTHHIFLALKARVPVMVAASRLEGDGCYHLVASPPIEMDSYPNREDELLYNGEKILAVAETIIRDTPSQWLISLPVWPGIEI